MNSFVVDGQVEAYLSIAKGDIRRGSDDGAFRSNESRRGFLKLQALQKADGLHHCNEGRRRYVMGRLL